MRPGWTGVFGGSDNVLFETTNSEIYAPLTLGRSTMAGPGTPATCPVPVAAPVKLKFHRHL